MSPLRLAGVVSVGVADNVSLACSRDTWSGCGCCVLAFQAVKEPAAAFTTPWVGSQNIWGPAVVGTAVCIFLCWGKVSLGHRGI